MIAVIADDFTGAAELGGIGLSYGLDVEIAMSIDPASTADLLVIATDARSVSEKAAVQEMTEVSTSLLEMKPEWIYKKIDSVLRGHLIPETLAQLRVLDLPRALLIPANPALGRTLVNGHYYVNGEPIHQTQFAGDPEFPVTESDVLKRFAGQADQFAVLPHSGPLPDTGIVIGEVESAADLKAWVNYRDNLTLVGGGSGFFNAILASKRVTKPVRAKTVPWGERWLYVCGSAFGESIALVKKAVSHGYPVFYLPIYSGVMEEEKLTSCVTAITASLQNRKPVILAIEPVLAENADAVQLRTLMAKTVKAVFERVSVNELVIEGGSTASAVLREMGVTRLIPTDELATGVVRCAAIGKINLRVTVKPGSYRWPTGLWPF